MKTSSWAPAALLGLHSRRQENRKSAKWIGQRNPVEDVKKMEERIGRALEPESKEAILRKLNRFSITLPDDEFDELLLKFISRDEMRLVWEPLSRRFKEDSDYIRFFFACQRAILGWRGAAKITPNERREYFEDIFQTAKKLIRLLNGAGEFDHYHVLDLVDKDKLHALYEEECAADAVHQLEEMLPDVLLVLMDIGDRAKRHIEQEAMIKKPGSKNAEIHYFIRSLSDYFQRNYNVRLHEVVAITAGVIFEEYITADHVRKLI
jgi:hypothetical protein